MSIKEFLGSTEGILQIAHLAAILEAGDRASYMNGRGQGDDGNPGHHAKVHVYTDRALDLIIAADATLDRAAARDDYLTARPWYHRPPTAEDIKTSADAGED